MESSYFSVALFASVLCLCQSYTLRNSVSWAVSSSDVVVVEGELDALSEEEEEGGAPALLGDNSGLWKQQQASYPTKVFNNADGARGNPTESQNENVAAPLASASRLFSYRMEDVKKTGASAATPPPHQETARVARYISHYSDWGFLATISTQDKIKGIPFGNIFSVSDGPLDNSTGVIYFYVTPMDNTVSDVKSFPYASLTFSEAEGDFCRQMMYDPEDPRCARLTLTGKMVEVESEELEFAKEAMFSRHPVMKKWPVGHQWFFMKLQLTQVWLQDWVGGVSLIPLEDYFKATPF